MRVKDSFVLALVLTLGLIAGTIFIWRRASARLGASANPITFRRRPRALEKVPRLLLLRIGKRSRAPCAPGSRSA
jgi:hypothetical protein